MRISDWSSDVCSSDLRIQNAATATVKGVEAEFQAAASDNLTLRGAVSLLDTEYKSFNPAPAVGPNGSFSIIDASGNRLVARSEEHTSELQSLMRISYAVFCLNKKIMIIHGTYQDIK